MKFYVRDEHVLYVLANQERPDVSGLRNGRMTSALTGRKKTTDAACQRGKLRAQLGNVKLEVL